MKSSRSPLLRIQLSTSARSFVRCSGALRAIGVDPSFLKSVKASLSPGETSLLRIQSKAPSICRARSWALWPRFLGNSLSSLRNSFVGSYRSSFFLLPLLRIQFTTLTRSFVRCSGERRESGNVPSLSNEEMPLSTSGLAGILLIQSRCPSSSRARWSGFWPCLFGSKESSFRKSPVASVDSLSFSLFRTQPKVSSRSLALCSGVRREIGT